MKEWKNLTAQGKKAYRERSFIEATEHHQQALETARLLFSNVFPEAPEQAIATVLVSYFNIIDCYESIHDFHKAIDLFISAKIFLEDIKVPADCIEHIQAAKRGSKLWQLEWLNFIRRQRDGIPNLLKQHSSDRLNSLMAEAGSY